MWLSGSAAHLQSSGERLTLTEHLGGLRVRLLLSVAVLTVLFAGCLWQSRSLLHVPNVPLAQLRTSPATEGAHGELPARFRRDGVRRPRERRAGRRRRRAPG